jgi:hypothetical protein
MTIQRRLIEALVPLMVQAAASTSCVNAEKAKLPIMREGLNKLKAIVDLAGQFLTDEALVKMILPVDAYQRYPPQSSQYALF